MGNSESKVDFKQVVAELASKQGRIDDGSFWEQFWSPSNVGSSRDVFDMIPVKEIRTLRNKSPENLATLCYKAFQTIVAARNAMGGDHKKVINCVRLLTRILPFMFEDAEWRSYFWTSVSAGDDEPTTSPDVPMASTLLGTLSDLLFCPDFTVASNSAEAENLSTIDSCQYIWEAGVGFATKPASNPEYDANRAEILKLLLTCFSEVIYIPLTDPNRMRWIMRFTSAENRHVLPLFTSMLNIVCAYDPVGYGVPYNYLVSTDHREPLVQAALHVLIVCLDKDSQPANDESGYADNFFINYLSRIHREEDFEFMLKGITRLLNNPLHSTYLPNSTKKISFHQELLILLWKCCEYNQKFMYFVLKTSDVLEILVPILFHINDSRNDQARVGLIHMGVFLILLLSGERNFGVRLNKPYTARAAIDVQSFTGTHADLLIIVFHKLITTGNHRLQSLFDCLLTIIVNVSPYLKSISMTAANKLVHLVEAFSTSWFLFSTPTNHHLVFFLLEVFNNIIQYQFDGNSNLIYTIIRKRQVFYQLANLSSDSAAIARSLSGRKTKTTVTEIVEQLKSSTSAATSPVSQLSSAVGELANPSVNPTLAATPDMTGKNDFASGQESLANSDTWTPTPEWVESWKSKLPLQTIMRLLQVLVPQVEKICIDKGLTDESEILKFLQHGTLVGLLPVPHPILIRKYQANAGTNHWFRTYMWGVIYLRNTEPPIWYDTEVNLFEIQRV